MPNFLARVATATLGTAAPAGLPARAPAPGGSWIARPPAIAADDGNPTALADRGTSGNVAPGVSAPDVAPPAVELIEPGPEPSAGQAGTTTPTGEEPGGATGVSPVAIRLVATAAAPGAARSGRGLAGAAGALGAARSTSPAAAGPAGPDVPAHVGQEEGVATADPPGAGAVRPRAAGTDTQEAQQASLLATAERGRRHVVRVPPSLRGGSGRSERDQADAAQASPDDGSLRALAALLASPVPNDDTIVEADAQPPPAMQGRVTVGSGAAAGGIGTTIELPVRAELEAAGGRGVRRDAAGWHLSVGRVEVQVDNRTPPPAPPRREPVTVAVDPLERRFVDRFRLRS
jgi:hypothetical protein